MKARTAEYLWKYRMKKILTHLTVTIGLGGLTVPAASAHCPLCTIGAGAVALGAVSLGLSTFSVGVFIGAFGLALGLWFGRLIAEKRYYWRYQTPAIGIISFLITVLPLEGLFYDAASIYISMTGGYGSLLNRTYYIDKFLAGSIIGAVILFISPALSRILTRMRKGRMLPYQGIVLTLVILLLASTIFEIAS